jgi:hypothetical protein
MPASKIFFILSISLQGSYISHCYFPSFYNSKQKLIQRSLSNYFSEKVSLIERYFSAFIYKALSLNYSSLEVDGVKKRVVTCKTDSTVTYFIHLFPIISLNYDVHF